MNPHAELTVLKDLVEERIGTIFARQSPESLYDPMAWVMKAGGKRLRPLLVMLSCRSVGGTVEDCIDAALAVEILHAFTLVHDDIMDNDETRRGLPTIHKKWNDATAILAGDGLVTKAYQILLQNGNHVREVLSIFTDGLMELCEGQALDKEFEDRDGVSMEEYREMIRKKTSRLIEVACDIGAVLGGASQEERRALHRFSSALGEAFQIQDDLLDLTTDEAVSGKPQGSDISERKKTFLTIHFHEHASAADRTAFAEYYGSGTLSAADRESVIRLLNNAGSIEAAQAEIAALARSAVEGLGRLPGENEGKTLLLHLAEQIQYRNK
ncbi:polyprenyl synthetase family protein [bacterium]|nr:polyprenyl synthetase family protein [bacterium]